MNRGVYLVVSALCACTIGVLSIGLSRENDRIADAQQKLRALVVRTCVSDENAKLALREAIEARIADPTTPEVVKAKFRVLIHKRLEPLSCPPREGH